jgi:hypothetical protein
MATLVYICFSICLVVGIKYAEAATCSVTAACEYGNLKKGTGERGGGCGCVLNKTEMLSSYI